MTQPPDPLFDLQHQLRELDNSRPPAIATPQPPPCCQLTCPKCRQKITVLNEHLGVMLECSLCGYRFRGSLKSEAKLQARLADEASLRETALRMAEDHNQEPVSETNTASTKLFDHPTSDDTTDITPDEAVEKQTSAEHQRSDHRWPFDHRRHPAGWPIHWYMRYWLVLFAITLASWLVLLYCRISPLGIASQEINMTQYALSWALLVWSWLLAGLTLLSLSGVIGAIVSHGKGRPHREGFVFGFFLGPIGWLLAGQMPDHPADH
ncbi:MAG: hypothetical protein HJJLKODD_02818 [Phycisphaerae bacterium]|nr:hypothetical protein [Phycisphaerae bacterium]